MPVFLHLSLLSPAITSVFFQLCHLTLANHACVSPSMPSYFALLLQQRLSFSTCAFLLCNNSQALTTLTFTHWLELPLV